MNGASAKERWKQAAKRLYSKEGGACLSQSAPLDFRQKAIRGVRHSRLREGARRAEDPVASKVRFAP